MADDHKFSETLERNIRILGDTRVTWKELILRTPKQKTPPYKT